MVELADGTLARADIGDLPGGGGGQNIVDDTFWDALGDLAVATGPDAAARLPIGAADEALVVSGGTAAWGLVQHAGLQDMAAWTLSMRNAGTGGVRADVKVTGLTTKAAAVGDWLLGEASTGELRRFDAGRLTIASDLFWSAKGDLAVATTGNTAVVLPVGANGTVLVADSGPAAGVAWDKVTHARGQDIGANTIQMRNAGTSGVRADVKISALTTEAAPTAGDFVMAEESGGALRKIDVGDLVIASDLFWAAKGDIAVATANDAASVLGVGANDLPIVADSVEATGLKYAKLTYAGIQDVSATDRLLGRDTAGAGVIEEIAPVAVRTMLSLVQGTDFEKSLSRNFVLAGEPEIGASELVPWFYTNVAITVAAIEALLPLGLSTPSVTLNVRHGTSFNVSPNDVCLANRVVTNVTNGDDLTLGGDVDIPAGSFVWVITSAASGTLPWLELALRYTED